MNNEKKLKYNFVFFFVHDDYWKAIIGKNSEHQHVFDTCIEGNGLEKWLNRIHFSYSLNLKYNLPFKSLWFRRMYRQKFDNDLPLCFVYLGGNSIRFDGGWCDYVRKMDKRNRQIVWHGDLISKKINWDYEELRRKVDVCLTYDKAEAEKYGIDMLPDGASYSKLIPNDTSGEYDYDVYYLADIKDRYDMILSVYHYLHNNGVRCCFLLAGVPESKREKLEGVSYISSISYEENLKHVVRSKCILEIKQGGSKDNFTLRHSEAVAYGRRMLTNSHVENCQAFNEGQLCVFDKAEDIDVGMIKAPMTADMYPAKIDLNTDNRLFRIQELLEKKGK